ncbi:hypothetical protein D3C78_1844650 [compost metagenome]
MSNDNRRVLRILIHPFRYKQIADYIHLILVFKGHLLLGDLIAFVKIIGSVRHIGANCRK